MPDITPDRQAGPGSGPGSGSHSDAPTARPAGRRIAVWQFLAAVVAYLVIVQGLTALLAIGEGGGHGGVTSIDSIIRSIVIPVGVGIAFVVVLAGRLGAWDALFVGRPPFRRWVVVIPIVLFVTVAAIANYPGLVAAGPTFALLLLVATLMVGFGEELLFRGIGITAFRDAGFSEFQVGLWTTVIFGVAHGSNIFIVGPSALLQVLLTTATGFVFYLILRSSGALVVSMAAHGLWDYSVLSSQIDPGEPWPLVNIAGVGLAVMLLIPLVMRRRLLPVAQADA